MSIQRDLSVCLAEVLELKDQEKQKKESIVATVREYMPSKEYWPVVATYLLGLLGDSAQYNNKIKFLNPLGQMKFLVFQCAALGFIVKHKRYAYFPAVLSQMIPFFICYMLIPLYEAVGYTVTKGSLVCEIYEMLSFYLKNMRIETSLLLLAAGYAYEVHQEKKKHKKREQEIVSEA